jgi:magnesium-transporting ATPase (P-type)
MLLTCFLGVFDNIRKFLQFQLTVNVVALTLTFLSALAGQRLQFCCCTARMMCSLGLGKEPPLNAVMMLWVNLIMDTMGALALGTEPPSETLLQRRPYKRNASLINYKMMRNIAVQFFFQMVLLAYLLFLGAGDFGCVEGSRTHVTIIFNTFVFCQVFNEINARSIGDEVNVFKGLFHNPVFLQIIAFTVCAQYGLVEYGGDFVKTVGLSHEQWIKCAILGSLSLPLGEFCCLKYMSLMRCICILGFLMRFIPVFEKQSDFAEVSPLVEQALKSKQKKMEKEPNASFQPSFVVYIVVLAICINLAKQHFGAKVGIFILSAFFCMIF